MFHDFSVLDFEKLNLGPGGALAGGGNSEEFGCVRPRFRTAIGDPIAFGKDFANRHSIFGKGGEQVGQEVLIPLDSRPEAADGGVMFDGILKQ